MRKRRGARTEAANDDRTAQASVSSRHRLHPDRPRVPLSCGDHGFGKPGGAGVLAVMHEFCNLPRNLIQHRGRGPLMA
jgi:hypothetical protein